MGQVAGTAVANDGRSVSRRPTFSVVMPVYNGAAHVGEALDSVLGQTFEDFEVVAVDDGSTDDSWAVLASYADRDRRIHPHRLPANRGHHVASNTAIEMASGRYIARLDQDDLAEPTRLARTMEAFAADPTVGLVHSHYVRWLPDGRRSVRTPPPTDAALRMTQLFRNTVCHSALAFSADVLARMDGWYRDLPGPQDYDLILRVLQRTRSCCVPAPLAVYRHETMAMTERFSDRMERAVDEISARHLTAFLPSARIAGARRVFDLSASTGDERSVRDVRAVFAGVVAADRLIDDAEATRFARHWTSRALRAALAPGGGLPRSARMVAELVRGDPAGSVRWAGDEALGAARALRRRLRAGVRAEPGADAG
jgi:hypothetical protein